MKKLLRHFKIMQEKTSRYLQPDSRIEPASILECLIEYLDGPDQREAQAEAEFDFVAESMVTCSNTFHGDKVGITDLLNALQDFSAAAERLDRMKKALFYGRDYIHNSTRPQASRPAEDEQSFGIIERIAEQIDVKNQEEGEDPWPAQVLEPLLQQAFHAILGVATESGEMVDAWLQAYKHNKPVDLVNLREEFGDNQWYVAIMIDALSKLLGCQADLDGLHRNVNRKLRHRFPDGFTEFDANNRDLIGERAILESDHPLWQIATDDDAPIKERIKALAEIGKEVFAGPPGEIDTFDPEEVAAGQDVFSAQPDYDPEASRKVVDNFSGVDPANGKQST